MSDMEKISVSGALSATKSAHDVCNLLENLASWIASRLALGELIVQNSGWWSMAME